MKIKKCSGCNLTSESSNNSCNITVRRSNCLKIECCIRKFFNNITNEQQIKLEIPLNELQNITKLQILESEEQILTESILIIEPHKQWILNSVNERYFDMLYNIYISNKEKSNLSFYIDGSVFNIGSNDVSMGAGIVQIENNKVVNEYSVGVSLWPSSTHTEISAFLLALLVCPENAKINIYTDSQTTINTYTYLTHNEMKSITKRNFLKIKNNSLWDVILSTINRFNLKVKLIKVKAHSGNKWNEEADKLAKIGTNKFPISIKFDNFSYQKFKLMWNNLPVDDHTRSFIKKTTDAFNYQNWKNLNRNKNFNNEQYGSIDWQSTFAALRGHIKKRSFLTSFKLNNQKAFRVKVFQNELPIMENLKKRRPDLYSSRHMCKRCERSPEILSHLWNCEEVHDIIKIISITITNYFKKKLIKYLSETNTDTINMVFQYCIKYFKTIKQLKDVNEHIYIEIIKDKKFILSDKIYTWDNKGSLDDLLSGYITLDLIQQLYKITRSNSKARKLAISLANIVNKELFGKIWIERCKIQNNWEKEYGISMKNKFNTKGNKRIKRNKKNNNNNNIVNSNENNVNNINTNLVPDWIQVITNHIRFGKNNLDFYFCS